MSPNAAGDSSNGDCGLIPNLYGTMLIAPFETVHGARKIVNIPWGFQKRLYNVTVPPDTRAGNILRLNRLGKITRDGKRGYAAHCAGSRNAVKLRNFRSAKMK